MQIKVYKTDTYKDCKIYYRSLGMFWEYLLILKNEIYTASIQVKPTFINRVLFFLGIEKDLFSQQQQTNILKVLKKMGETTVDHILNLK